MQNEGNFRFYYCKSEHWSIFTEYVNEIDVQMQDFRGFTIVKVIIGRFSKHKSTKKPQNARGPTPET